MLWWIAMTWATLSLVAGYVLAQEFIVEAGRAHCE